MFQIEVVEKIKTHILCSVTFFLKNRDIYKITWKNMVEVTDDNMADVHCILDN